jgi:hypothetical protein
MVAPLWKAFQSPPHLIVIGEKKVLRKIETEGRPWAVIYPEVWKTAYVDPNLFPSIALDGLATWKQLVTWICLLGV